MEKLFILIVILMSLFTACSNDVTSVGDTSGLTVGPNISLLAPHAQKLINQGDQMLDTAVDSFTNMSAETRNVLKKTADYAMFPLYYAQNKNFSQRMSDIFTGDNNFVTSHALIMARITNSSVSPSIISRSAGSRGITKDDIQAGADIAAKKFPAAAPFIDIGIGVLNFFGIGGPSEEEQILEQVQQMGKQLDQIQNEMRQGFSAINTRLDTISQNLDSLKGDVNLLSAGISASIKNDFDLVKGNFEGFTISYSAALNSTEASNKAYDYLIESSSFDGNLVNVIDMAKSLQSWALTNSKYTSQYIETDPHAGTNIFQFYGTWSTQTNYFYYANPKPLLIVTIGGLEYITKMITMRISMNSILYRDPAARKAKNQLLAQIYLNLLDSKGITANAQQVVNQFENTYKTHYSVVNTGRFPGQDSISYYKDDVYIGTDSSYMSDDYRNQFRTLLNTARDNALNDYMMIWLVKLVKLQVLLKSYL